MSLKEIYSQSFQVVKNNKALWVFGLVVATATAGSGIGAGSNFNNLDNLKELNESSVSATAKQEFNSVLTTVLNFASTIPTSTWLILVLGILTALIFTIILSLLLRSWAVGALIGGTYDALDERNQVSLATIGDRGLRSFKGLTGLYLVPQLLVVLIFFPLIGVGFLAIFQQALFGFPLVVISVLGLLFCVILVDITTLWAERLIAITNIPWTKAFWQGLKLFQNYFGQTIKLGCANVLLGCGAGCLLTVVIGPIIAVLVIIGLIPFVGWALIPFLLLLAVIIFLAVGLINAILLTFKYTTWSALFKEITK